MMIRFTASLNGDFRDVGIMVDFFCEKGDSK